MNPGMSGRLRRLAERKAELKAKIRAERKVEVPGNPVEFAEWLGVKLYQYQKTFLEALARGEKFIALRWARQTGKTFTAGLALLWYAASHPGSWIMVTSASFRQAKQVLYKISGLTEKLKARGVVEKNLRTKIYFKNGSLIEAFAPNPDTLRGPTINLIYWDEAGFTPHDEEVYTAILFTLGTTGGTLIASSTCGSSDTVFYRMCTGYPGYWVSRIPWSQALHPQGPLNHETLSKIKAQLQSDLWRWRREMEVEFAEDEERWLPLKLITECTDGELEFYDHRRRAEGEFYLGVDLGRRRDYTVISAVQAQPDRTLNLTLCHRLPLGSELSAAVGFLKALTDRWKTVHRIAVDQTGLGEYVVEDLKNSLGEVEGVIFTETKKEELALLLLEYLRRRKLRIPYDRELIEELHTERYQITKTGRYRFTHPPGRHDDRFWSIALALHAAQTPRFAAGAGRRILEPVRKTSLQAERIPGRKRRSPDRSIDIQN